MKQLVSLLRRMTLSRAAVTVSRSPPDTGKLEPAHVDVPSIAKLISVHGIGLGTLNDNRAFLTQSGLSSFLEISAERPPSVSARLLGKVITVYLIDDIASHALRELNGTKLTRESIVNFVLVQAGHCVGHPRCAELQLFHERITLAHNFAPKGRFVVPKELSDLIVKLKLCGTITTAPVEAVFAADQAWSNYWDAEWLAQRFAAKNRYLMSYPKYVPGRERATQSPHSYPVEALAIFRQWVAESEICDRLGLDSARLRCPEWRWPLSVSQAATPSES